MTKHNMITITTALVGCWWLLREIELASLIASAFAFLRGPNCGQAEHTIRASKSDPDAVGCKRKLACMCPSAICPAAAAKALVKGKCLGDHFLQDSRGEVMSKQDTVRLLKAFAAHANVDTERITGPSMMTTGAGLSTTQIKALRRRGEVRRR